MWMKACTLIGNLVVLEPLSLDHVPALSEAVMDGEGWRLWFANVPSPDKMADYVQTAMKAAKQGDIAFAVRVKQTGQIIGTTRLYNVDSTNRRLMLGYTWYAASARRTGINTECKLLLLKYVFETQHAIAVEFRTHFFNQASRTAIERLGAKQDGILRQHQIMPDGSYRDTVVYSIIASEWPAVKCHLLSKLAR
ncbi:GNAT family N-acetyltransferase [Shewanella sp. SR44-3]|uniref:GNAT family N-acetyltransferase n=1 Tax=Shewanella sp. SR44-3 TaxID=2760936 RepID=UPI0015FC5C4D|nr:GNAT family protein [Shewanella sp. SR44-3]MBB1269693.1 GNAT family N-acetyltransferase [Shewanella sp. SR44-3]